MQKMIFLFLLVTGFTAMKAEDPKTLSIGTAAPDFKLPGTDDKTYTLASFKNSNILVVIFTCNHCPTAQAYEDRMIQLAKDYSGKGVAIVAVSPNDPTAGGNPVKLDKALALRIPISAILSKK